MGRGRQIWEVNSAGGLNGGLLWISGPKPGTVGHPWGHLMKPGDFWGLQLVGRSWGAAGKGLVETRGAAKYPTM